MPKGVQMKKKKVVNTKQFDKAIAKKGHSLTIAPKRSSATDHCRTSTTVSKIINRKNEEMIRNRADNGVGRSTTGGSNRNK